MTVVVTEANENEMILILVLVTFVVIVLVSWFISYYKYEKYLKKYRGPNVIPIIGNALEVTSTADILPTFMKWREEYGTVMKAVIGFGPPGLQISDAKTIEALLSKSKFLDKSTDYRFLHSWLGTGLLTSSSTKWKKHRRILTPAFHFQILEQFIEVFNSYSDILIKKLEKEIGKDSFDIYPYVTLCSLDIICASAMGVDVRAQEESDSEYVRSVKEMCRILIERTMSMFKSQDLLYLLSRDYWKERKAVKVLHNFTNSVITLRKKALENSSSNAKVAENGSDDVGIKKRKAFLDLLLEYKMNGQPISDEDIREEVDTFMFEGHDTTASGVTFTLYCLANNPEIQEKVVAELNSILGDDKSNLAQYRDLQEMKYLEMVIKESLRLYPSVPFFGRNVHEDLEFDGTLLPKDITLTVLVHAIHKCPNIYPDPERFDPERFTPENQSKRSPYAYVPFSAGPRNCIGQRFAMLELKAVISKILRNYELLPAVPEHKLCLVAEAVLKSSNGVRIGLRKRT